ncbi:MAG: LamG domain-containing protein, partial [Chloroflexota bacterium]|nr:LamG domain-containing protein [Chloroflexota bacterium]
RDIITAVLGGAGVATSNLRQIQVYRVAADGSPDPGAVNTYTPPFTQTVGGATVPYSTTGHFTWPPCQRQATEPTDSVGVGLTYAYHPLVALPGVSTLALGATTAQRITPPPGTTPCPIPGIPTGVTVADAALQEPPPTGADRLTWNVVPGAARYNIYAAVNGAGYGASPVMSVISATATGITQTATYPGNTAFAPTSYEVTGVNYCGEGQRSVPAANQQCALPVTPTILAATAAVTPSTDLITYTAPWTSAPISATYLVTQTSGPAPSTTTTFTIPISPSAPLTRTAALSPTGTDPVAYQMSAVNACGVVGAASASVTRPVAPPPPAPPPSAGLVGWWRFDEGTGTATADASGHGHDGALAGGVTWASGPTAPFTDVVASGGPTAPFTDAVSFNGVTGYVATVVGSGTDLPAAGAAQSISWWMEVASNPGSTQTVMALTNDAGASAVQPGFRSGQVGVWKYGGAFLVATTPPSVGRWHHYVYTYDGMPGVQGTHQLYVDGVRVATSTVPPQTATPTALQFGRWTGGSEYFQGALDDVRIYTRALSLSEVHALDTQP